MDRNFKLFTAADDPELFKAALDDARFAAMEAHPQLGAFGRSYYPAAHSDRHRDYSFGVTWQNEPRLLVACSAVDDTLGMHGLPARFFSQSDLDPEIYEAAVKFAFSQIDLIVSKEGLAGATVRERSGDTISPVGEACINRGARAEVMAIGIVDLRVGPAGWKKSLRKRFQQFINWGRDNLVITRVNKANFSQAEFDRYRYLHAQVAGRVTRPIESWTVMKDWVEKGLGELILAERDTKLVGAVLFIDGTNTCLYMSGAFDRDSDKPLAHYMLWVGLDLAQERGMTDFELGEIHQLGTVDDKQYNIGYFKRGFMTRADLFLDWRWRANHTE